MGGWLWLLTNADEILAFALPRLAQDRAPGFGLTSVSASFATKVLEIPLGAWEAYDDR